MTEPTSHPENASRIVVACDSANAIVSEAPVQWAVEQLVTTLDRAGVSVSRSDSASVEGSEAALHVVVTGPRPDVPDAPESFVLSRPDGSDGPVHVAGRDARGIGYGVLELADVAAFAADPEAAMRAVALVTETPATAVRSINRVFVSDVEDKPWFYDRAFWAEYLTELATNRINRLQLGFGMQYNYGHHPATDNYLCFPYPFLLDVPGYDVRVGGLSDEERRQNLEALRFISDETKRRGIHFQLGLWNHAYDQGEGSVHRYPIEGLTPETHAQYCAVALEQLLRECPSIDGLTVRVHYEGGVPEPGHDFWRTVFAGVPPVGRRIELDLHSKGVDQALIDIARDTGMPVVLGAKYWAEHQGLPYHQTTIREREHATKEPGTGLMAITQHQRRFTRYGYGDFLPEGRDFDLLFRIWPGTQKVLLWGDPALAAGYGRLGTLGGALGIELCEPLFFKGRKGTGAPGGRDPYIDPALKLGLADWRKYRYTYRLWGRLLYNPDADASGWRRFLTAEYGPAAVAVEQALGAASRVLPLITTVHGLGASNNGYWPEMYVNMPIGDGPNAELYERDTAAPPTFGGVSAFDPAMFYRVDEYADDLLAGRRDGRYTPAEVADWFDALAEEAERKLAIAVVRAADPAEPTFRRTEIDIRVQAGLGRFFAAKYRAGIGYSLFERTQDPAFLAECVAAYRMARDIWAGIAELATGVYQSDLTFGDLTTEHGHWADRLPAIEEDLASLERRYGQVRDTVPATPVSIPDVPRSSRPRVEHTQPEPFTRAETITVEATITDSAFDGRILLHYRHLNQGEDFQTVEMTREGQRFAATMPASYTDSDFPLVYYFTVRDLCGDAWIVPGLDRNLANQPYCVLRQKGRRTAVETS